MLPLPARTEKGCYIIPGIPPGIPPPPPPCSFGSGLSATMASVVRSKLETLAAFWSAVRTTLVGSIMAAGNVLAAQKFMLTPLTSMGMFAGFFVAAVIYRTKPRIHKRLMMVATISMLDAPISRLAFVGDPPHECRI